MMPHEVFLRLFSGAGKGNVPARFLAVFGLLSFSVFGLRDLWGMSEPKKPCTFKSIV